MDSPIDELNTVSEASMAPNEEAKNYVTTSGVRKTAQHLNLYEEVASPQSIGFHTNADFKNNHDS